MMHCEIIEVDKLHAAWPHICRHSPQTVRYAEDPGDGGNYTFIAAVGEGGEFLGLCVIDVGAMPFGPLAGEVACWLEDVLVLEPHRRRGIGTALLEAALARAWQAGARYARWTVTYDNAAGIALYRKTNAIFLPEEDPAVQPPERYYTVVMPRPPA